MGSWFDKKTETQDQSDRAMAAFYEKQAAQLKAGGWSNEQIEAWQELDKSYSRIKDLCMDFIHSGCLLLAATSKAVGREEKRDFSQYDLGLAGLDAGLDVLKDAIAENRRLIDAAVKAGVRTALE